MPKHNNLKICVVATSLSDGGTERFSATLSHILINLGYDVFIVSTKNCIDYKYAGQLFNLEIESKSKRNFKKLVVMRRFFKKEKFDIIIDNRARRSFFKEFLIYRLLYNQSRVISMIHNYNIYNYFPDSKNKAEIIYKHNKEFVGVSKSIKQKVIDEFCFNNVHYIHNPINLEELKVKSEAYKLDLSYQYILYFGRFEEASKNLTLLIKSYAISQLVDKNIKLILLGKGEDLAYLKDLVDTMQLQNMVIFMGYNPNPFPYVKHAKFTVLSSNYEGFPMSIIESLAVGTPVVSVDCESGPREVIHHNKNGLLVKSNDKSALSSAFNLFLNDEKLYLDCKQNATESVAHLNVNAITSKWKSLIENETK